MPDPDDKAYSDISEEIRRKERIRASLNDMLYRMTDPAVPSDKRMSAKSVETAATALGIDVKSSQSFLQLGGGQSGVMGALNSTISTLGKEIASSAQTAFNLNPSRGMKEFGQYIDIKDQIAVAKGLGGGGGGGGFQPAPRQFQMTASGKVYSFDPNNGGVSIVGDFPDEVQKKIEVDKDGNLVAIHPFTGDVKILKEGYGHPQIDPRIQFQVQTAMGLANIDLAQRGQQISALGQDMANEIEKGRLTFQEAQTNLAIADSALNQRREDIKLAARYGIAQSRIFTGPTGQRMGRLPMAEEVAAAAGISPTAFELPVGTINPNQTANDVISSSAFTSPIPGLMAGLASTRDMISTLTNANIASAETARAAANKVAQGVK